MSEIVHREKSDFQDILIFDSAYFGRVLVLDDIVQTTERDEFAYHEMLVHVPIMSQGAARRVLIIGGGDGGCLREVLRHDTIELARLIDIDGAVIESCRKYMPSLSAGAFDDPRADVRVADGLAHIRDTDETYNVIIVDSTDPVGPGEVLFSDEFYQNCRSKLTAGGIVATQSGIPFFQAQELSDTVMRLRRVFDNAGAYLTVVPTYVGGYMALGWATDGQPLNERDHAGLEERIDNAALDTRYYNAATHQAAFALPPFIQTLLR
ncbi:MAG: polyamine aminopropyltransferase [Proteobacteria bacterium]|nr:polyamine aminopropyltransferase [Pseudomonadota bacterium]